MKSIALYSIKGGVGKTAAAVNLSWLASRKGSPTLLCDLDPQCASSFYFRITASENYSSGKFLKGSKKIYRQIRATDFENLDLLHSDLSYRNLDIELSEEKNPKKRLKKNLADLSEAYEYLFFDCPPNLTLLSESVFDASDIILVPVIPTTLSVRTYEQLLSFFEKNGLDAGRIRAFFSMSELRKTMHREIIDAFSETPGFLKSSIPCNSEIERMGRYRSPVNAHKPASAAAQAYRQLWEELIATVG